MDEARIRTFVEIARRGSFQLAAEALNVTQTTVSARIRTLEEELGRRLFHRNRNGAALTPAGESFMRYAQTILEVWERARHHVAVPSGSSRIFAIGAEISLWNPLLVDWMRIMRDREKATALRVQVAPPDQLVASVQSGVLDLALVYAPKLQPGLRVEMLVEDVLVLVRSRTRPDADYVHVDWGTRFAEEESRLLSERLQGAIHVGLGPLGLNYLLTAGGSGYFRRSAVEPYVREGRLAIVDGAPTFRYPIFAICSEQAEQPAIEAALAAVRDCVGTDHRPII